VAKLAALAEMALGHPLDQPTLNRLLAIQATLRVEQSKLVDLLDAGELTPDQYLTRLNSEVQRAMGENLKVLGEDRFQAIFGEAGRHPEGLVDRKLFMEHALSKP
jgi:hypothetical protein